MKIYSINNNNYNQNVNYKGANKFCKYSIRTLIASASLFMLSNAVDSFQPESTLKRVTPTLNTVASLLGIAGTCLGLFGIEKADSKDENR